MTAVVPPRDVFQRVPDLDQAALRRLVDRMEARRRDPTFSAWRESYLDRLDLAGASTVLEVGCGSGAVARAIAARPEVTGRILATDYSAALLAAAQELAGAEGLGDRIAFAVQDSQALTLPDASVDVAVAHTLVSHLAEPLRGLAELARVVRPGGQVAIFDGDYASLTFGGTAGSEPGTGTTGSSIAGGELGAGAAVEPALVAVMAANPTVLRTLPRLATAVGLSIESVTAHVLAEVGTGSFFLNFADTYGPLAAEAGLLPPEHLAAWLGEQRRAHHAGAFFAACNYYTYLLRRSSGGGRIVGHPRTR